MAWLEFFYCMEMLESRNIWIIAPFFSLLPYAEWEKNKWILLFCRQQESNPGHLLRNRVRFQSLRRLSAKWCLYSKELTGLWLLFWVNWRFLIGVPWSEGSSDQTPSSLRVRRSIWNRFKACWNCDAKQCSKEQCSKEKCVWLQELWINQRYEAPSFNTDVLSFVIINANSNKLVLFQWPLSRCFLISRRNNLQYLLLKSPNLIF